MPPVVDLTWTRGWAKTGHLGHSYYGPKAFRLSEPVDSVKKMAVYSCSVFVAEASEAMKQRTNILLVSGVLALALFGPAMAGPLQDGEAAYQRSDYTAALRILRPLADQENSDAQTYLGVMYRLGQGVPQDYAQAVAWLRKAADQGNAGAQAKLGGMYDDGQGVPQDYAQAVLWYRKAADQGDSDAQYSLGIMYAYGIGVPQDYIMAHTWFNLAASRGTPTISGKIVVKNRDHPAAKITSD